MKKKKHTHIIIGGYMHSGTTLLFDLISNSSEIFSAVKETKILEFQSNLKYKSEIKKRIIDKSFDIKSFKSINNIYKDYYSIYNQLALENNMFYSLDGSPNNYMFFSDLNHLKLNSKLILLVRNPLDIIASVKKRSVIEDIYKNKSKSFLKKKKLEKKFNLLLHSFSVKKSFQIMNDLNKKNKNILLINYKDLTTKTSDVLHEISSFLGLNSDLQQITKLRYDNSSHKKSEEQNTGEIISFRSNYKNTLSSNEIKFIEKYFTGIFNFEQNNISKNINKLNYYLFLINQILILPSFLFNFLFSRIILLNNSNKLFDYLKLRIKRLFWN